jgi:hypothetical protein
MEVLDYVRFKKRTRKRYFYAIDIGHYSVGLFTFQIRTVVQARATCDDHDGHLLQPEAASALPAHKDYGALNCWRRFRVPIGHFEIPPLPGVVPRKSA